MKTVLLITIMTLVILNFGLLSYNIYWHTKIKKNAKYLKEQLKKVRSMLVGKE